MSDRRLDEVPQWIENLPDRELLYRLAIPVDNSVDATTRRELKRELTQRIKEL